MICGLVLSPLVIVAAWSGTLDRHCKLNYVQNNMAVSFYLQSKILNFFNFFFIQFVTHYFAHCSFDLRYLQPDDQA